MPIFKGAGVAIVTPFTQDDKVNYEELGKMIDFQIASGTDAIIICGTTGESATLNHEEHVECIKRCIEHVNKRVPVIAGTGSNDTSYAIALSREAERLGIDMNIIDECIPISERQKAFMPKKQTRAQDYYTQKGYEEHLQNVMRQSMAGYYEESYERYKENYKMAMKNAGFTDYDRQFLSYYIDKLSDFDFFRITFDNDLFNIQYVYRDGSYNMKVEMIASQLQAELDRQGKKYKEFIPEDYGL